MTLDTTDDQAGSRARKPGLAQRVRRFMPAQKWQRQTLGVILVLAGALLGFLPIFGYWMIPLGLLILSIDSPFIRKARRRLEVAWGRWRARNAPNNGAQKPIPGDKQGT